MRLLGFSWSWVHFPPGAQNMALTRGYIVSAGCVEVPNHVLLTFLVEKLLTFTACLRPNQGSVVVTFFNRPTAVVSPSRFRLRASVTYARRQPKARIHPERDLTKS